MEELTECFSKLNISEKNIINKIMDKNNNLDELIDSSENLNLNIEQKCKNNKEILNITENLQMTINKVVDFFKILRNKERCYIKEDIIIPKWIF
jgi:hypothetical protein